MNLYFLVEGRRTERKVYPKWLSYLLPELREVRHYHEVTENSYYIFSGCGYPSILDNHLINSIEEVRLDGRYDYLIMCIDADEVNVDDRKSEVEKFLSSHKIELPKKTQFVLIIQNRCIETWFLGNRRVYKNNPTSDILREYCSFYNVRTMDPELMGNIGYFETHSQFHGDYLAEMLRERNIRYTKKNPQGVVEEAYFKELIGRSTSTPHIQTFKEFVEFCNMVKAKLK